MNFELILEKIESVVPTRVRDEANYLLDVTLTKSRQSSSEYRVTVPKDCDIDEFELLTRCDNKAHDLRTSPGTRYHFGGRVEWVSKHVCKVTVYTD